MPQYDYSSSGAAVTGALTQYLAEQEARQRQAMLDQIMQQRDARADTAQAMQQAQQAQALAHQQRAFEHSLAKETVDMAGEDERLQPGPAADAVREYFPGRITSEMQPGPEPGSQGEDVVGPFPGVVEERLRPGSRFEDKRASELARADAAMAASADRAKIEATRREDRLANEKRDDDFRQSQKNIENAIAQQGAGIRASEERRDATAAATKLSDATTAKLAKVENEIASVEGTARALDDLLQAKPTKEPDGTQGYRLGPGTLAIVGKSRKIGKGLKRYIGGNPEATAESALNHIRGKLVLDLMSELKKESSQGATGFGALAAPELKLLENAASRLDPTMEEGAFLREVIHIRNTLQVMFAKGNTIRAQLRGASGGTSGRAQELIQRYQQNQ